MAFRLGAKCQAQRDFNPIPWTDYFDEAHDVRVEPNSSFRVYLRNFRSPYAPERNFGDKSKPGDNEGMTETDFNGYSQYPTLVMLHGGGYSGLTWAQFTSHIEKECLCRLIAIDLRSHGDTKTDDDDKMDCETLVDDVIQVIEATHRLCGFPEVPRTVLIGHSMGGALAIRCAARASESLALLVGFVIIDVVEGTAKDALPVMMNVIKTRPIKFPSLANAIEWSVRSGMAKNLNAARVSMPGNLVNMTTGHLAIHDVESKSCKLTSNIRKHKFHINMENLLASSNHRTMVSLPPNLPQSSRIARLRSNPDGLGGSNFGELPRFDDRVCSNSTLKEEASEDCRDDVELEKVENESADQIDNDGYRMPPNVDDVRGYCWRTDLAKTQPHWPGWFEGLSEMMLNAPVQGKFLLLAGIDRLDKTLTIGQMQGKFMMRVLPKCGHAVHEDSPERVAAVIGEFLIKHKFTTMYK